MRRTFVAMIAAAALFALLALPGAQSARAQCAIINVYNFTGCDVTLCLYDAGGNRACIQLRQPIGPYPLAFVAPFNPAGVISSGKNLYPFAGSPACTPCVTLPSPTIISGCCATVCYDPVACTITVNPCGPPCLP
ncbi:MAG TPA: hypothetical protein VHI13_02085 [Candidatus Kapabacteria bacterium]|nr:hypothetical protein [Candidatus Kapabacteria bacterium]